MSSDNCAMIQSITFDPPERPWSVTTATAVAGDSSLRSADIENGEQSCLVLELQSLSINSVVSVAGRTSSEGALDQLQIMANKLLINTISAPRNQAIRDWQLEDYFLPATVTTLRWCYIKNETFDLGADAAWIDNLSFNSSDIPYKNRICNALDIGSNDCSMIQSVTYEPPERLWVITSATFIAGVNSLRSADIGDDQSTCLVLTLIYPFTQVSFSRRLSFDGPHDFLYFETNIQRLDNFSPPEGPTIVDWQAETLNSAADILTLRWCYNKDESITQGNDSVWIDNLSLELADKVETCVVLDLSPDNCTMVRSFTYDPPQFPWFITTATSVAGGSSLRSADIDDNQQSCLVLAVSLPANSVITADGRTSSQGAADVLQIQADNLLIDTISAPDITRTSERDWRPESYFLPAAVSTLSWCYTKNDDIITLADDAAWIDRLSFRTSNISYLSRVCTALDITDSSCSMIQSVTYDPPEKLWVITSATSVAGGTSMRSADIDNNQQTCLVLALSLPFNAFITAFGRTSSQGGLDPLQILADNLTLDSISAPHDFIEREWLQVNYFLPTAISTLRWCFANSRVLGVDHEGAAWIDNLNFSTSNISYQSRICTALDLTASNCSMIRSLTFDPPEKLWIITSATSVVGGTSLRSADIDANQNTCLNLALELPVNAVISVAGRVSSEGGVDQLAIQADNLRLDTISANFGGEERDWVQVNYVLQTAISTLSWCYSKDAFRNEGNDSVWIDNLSFSTSNISFQSRICNALDIPDDRCRLIESVTFDPPQLLWIITPATSVAGGSSLRSPDIGRNQSTCLRLRLPAAAGAMISLAVRTSTLPPSDQLIILADDLSIDTILARSSGIDTGWNQETYFLQTAITILSMCYVKNDDSLSAGSDAAWVDNLSYVVSEQDRICLALDIPPDSCDMIRSVTYDPPQQTWLTATQTFVAGGSSIRSPAFNVAPAPCLVIGLSLPANAFITLDARTSSEGGVDQLQINADNLRLDTISAAHGSTERDWRQETYYLQTGISNLSICYAKNDRIAGGQDIVWVDRLSFGTSDIPYKNRICDALDLSESRCTLVQSVTFDPPEKQWIITSATSVAGGSSLRSADIDDSESTCLNLRLDLPSDSRISFSHRRSFEGRLEMVNVMGSDARLIEQYLILDADISFVDWQSEEIDLLDNVSTLTVCYEKNLTLSAGDDSYWFDNFVFIYPEVVSFCDAVDLPVENCKLIQSVSFQPPQSRWEATDSEPLRGTTALESPQLNTGDIPCVNAEFGSNLSPGSLLRFSWRTASQSNQDFILFQEGAQQRRISNSPQWRDEYIELDNDRTRLTWCYTKNSADAPPAGLDNFLLVPAENRYRIQIAVTSAATLISSSPETFQFGVTVSVGDSTLPPPSDWVLIVSGSENIHTETSTYLLVFNSNVSEEVAVISTPDNPFLPSSVLLSLADRISFLGAVATSISYSLPTVQLAILEIMAPTAVDQPAMDAPIEFGVVVNALDNFDRPIDLTVQTLYVTAVDNANVLQSSYTLTFTGGQAQTSVTVEFATRGFTGLIEISVSVGDINSTALITLNPVPRKLLSIQLSAADTSLVQMQENTAVTAELILTTLDNYGDPIEGGSIDLQLSASNGAMVQTTWTLIIDATGSTRQTVEILPQNDLDTTVTVQLSRGSQDQSVQLLPDGGLQIAVRALRILRQLQLSLADRISPLQQIDQSLSIRARVQLIGLDQYDQPIAFTETTLTATTEPATTAVTLNPPQLSSALPAGVITVLEVMFPETMATTTTVTITIANPGTDVTTNALVVLALPDPRPSLPSLNIDSDPNITELDLIVALRWMVDRQSSTASLVVNLTVTTADITATGIANLQRLFTEPEFLTRIDLNGDGRADQLDLRVLLRWLSGLRGTQLAEQGISDNAIRLIHLLLDQP